VRCRHDGVHFPARFTIARVASALILRQARLGFGPVHRREGLRNDHTSVRVIKRNARWPPGRSGRGPIRCHGIHAPAAGGASGRGQLAFAPSQALSHITPVRVQRSSSPDNRPSKGPPTSAAVEVPRTVLRMPSSNAAMASSQLSRIFVGSMACGGHAGARSTKLISPSLLPSSLRMARPPRGSIARCGRPLVDLAGRPFGHQVDGALSSTYTSPHVHPLAVDRSFSSPSARTMSADQLLRKCRAVVFGAAGIVTAGVGAVVASTKRLPTPRAE
jgi:hypothetical protein